MAELFGNSRSQQLAAGQPSDVLALCWILASAERDRSLKSARKGGRVNNCMVCCAFPRAREGGASASGFDRRRRRASYRDCSARADRNRWPRGGCGVCALWHFRLGDRLLIGGRAGAERRAANSWSPGRRCWPTARPAAVFCLDWRSAVAELFGNSRSQQLAAGQPSDVLALCWILASAERDRSLKSARKGGRVSNVLRVSSCARGRRLGQRFRSGGAGAELWGTVRREPIETAGQGVAALRILLRVSSCA